MPADTPMHHMRRLLLNIGSMTIPRRDYETGTRRQYTFFPGPQNDKHGRLAGLGVNSGEPLQRDEVQLQMHDRVHGVTCRMAAAVTAYINCMYPGSYISAEASEACKAGQHYM